jgi:integrase
LSAADVMDFVRRECRRHSLGYSRLVVGALRSLLLFLYLDGLTETPLAAAALPIAGWRLGSLPKALEPQHVERLLRSCDRRTAIGRRDYAILMLLVRLGLRAGEVSSLQLGDIDWSGGEVVIRGKGRRLDRLPLPVDVGEALVAYLRRGRPSTTDRRLFIRSRAPRVGISRSCITAVVYHACDQSGAHRVGSHRLRHTAATLMLQRGESLSAIAQVLRHRRLATTAIYAKVDRRSLRLLAQPWPGDRP